SQLLGGKAVLVVVLELISDDFVAHEIDQLISIFPSRGMGQFHVPRPCHKQAGRDSIEQSVLEAAPSYFYGWAQPRIEFWPHARSDACCCKVKKQELEIRLGSPILSSHRRRDYSCPILQCLQPRIGGFSDPVVGL